MRWYWRQSPWRSPARHAHGRPANVWDNPVTFWHYAEHEDPHNDSANAAPGANLDAPGAPNRDTTPDRCRAGAGRDPRRDCRRERSTVTAPAVSTAYPTVPAVDRGDPGTYAVAFTTELLDTNFAVQSRDALLAWAEHEEAPNTLPGVPASVAGKALVLSLADPDLPGGSPSPVPSAPQWVADATSGVSQSVADVQAEVAPDWTQIISEGWQPRDPLMTVETVTGSMTVTTNGVAAAPKSFSLSVTLGSAADVRAGYGAVAVVYWTLD